MVINWIEEREDGQVVRLLSGRGPSSIEIHRKSDKWEVYQTGKAPAGLLPLLGPVLASCDTRKEAVTWVQKRVKQRPTAAK